MNADAQLWVEVVGDLIIARVRGEPTEALGAARARRAARTNPSAPRAGRPHSKLAFLARIAFGEGDYRVFYNDMVAAVKWLSDERPD